MESGTCIVDKSSDGQLEEVHCVATANVVDLIANDASHPPNIHFKESVLNLDKVISKKTSVDRGLDDVMSHLCVVAGPFQREDAEIQNTLKACSPIDGNLPDR